MNEYHLEVLSEERLPEVLEIYNHYVVHTTATFHKSELTVDEMRDIVFFDDDRHKTFAIIEGEKLCGYILLATHKNREAYHNTAEVTVYLKPEYTGRGIGGFAVGYIEAYAKEAGFHVLIATICGENEQSMRLFEKNGYDRCAHYREVGMKFGRYMDVVAYQKIL
jgi:L-amino acid N-acyltransferase YncA